MRGFEWSDGRGENVLFFRNTGALITSDSGVDLTPKAATDLASHLLQWATQNREPFDDQS